MILAIVSRSCPALLGWTEQVVLAIVAVFGARAVPTFIDLAVAVVVQAVADFLSGWVERRVGIITITVNLCVAISIIV